MYTQFVKISVGLFSLMFSFYALFDLVYHLVTPFVTCCCSLNKTYTILIEIYVRMRITHEITWIHVDVHSITKHKLIAYSSRLKTIQYLIKKIYIYKKMNEGIQLTKTDEMWYRA